MTRQRTWGCSDPTPAPTEQADTDDYTRFEFFQRSEGKLGRQTKPFAISEVCRDIAVGDALPDLRDDALGRRDVSAATLTHAHARSENLLSPANTQQAWRQLPREVSEANRAEYVQLNLPALLQMIDDCSASAPTTNNSQAGTVGRNPDRSLQRDAARRTKSAVESPNRETTSHSSRRAKATSEPALDSRLEERTSTNMCRRGAARVWDEPISSSRGNGRRVLKPRMTQLSYWKRCIEDSCSEPKLVSEMSNESEYKLEDPEPPLNAPFTSKKYQCGVAWGTPMDQRDVASDQRYTSGTQDRANYKRLRTTLKLFGPSRASRRDAPPNMLEKAQPATKRRRIMEESSDEEEYPIHVHSDERLAAVIINNDALHPSSLSGPLENDTEPRKAWYDTQLSREDADASLVHSKDRPAAAQDQSLLASDTVIYSNSHFCQSEPELKVPVFTGKHWTSFVNQFERLARYRKWDDDTKAMHLYNAIDHEAVEALAEEDSRFWSYERLVKHIGKRHGKDKTWADIILAGQLLRRKPGQSLTSFYDEVVGLINQADFCSDHLQNQAFHIFLNGLQADRAMLNQVMPNLKKQSLHEIFNLVEEYEIRSGAPSWNIESSSRRGNTASTDSNVLAMDAAMGSSYVNSLERLKQEQDQLKLTLEAIQKKLENTQYQTACPEPRDEHTYRQECSDRGYVLEEPARRIDLSTLEFYDELDIKQIAQEQQADPDLQLLYELKQTGAEKPTFDNTALLSEAAEVYFRDWHRIDLDRKGVLYRQCKETPDARKRRQIILPLRLRIVLKDLQHGTVESEHHGRRRALRSIQRQFYWYQMSRDIRTWLKECSTCQQRSHVDDQLLHKATSNVLAKGMPGSSITSFSAIPASTPVLGTTWRTTEVPSRSRKIIPPERKPQGTNGSRFRRMSLLASDNHALWSPSTPARSSNGFATTKRYITPPKASKFDVAEYTSNTALCRQQRACDTLTQLKRLDPLGERNDSGISSDNDSTVSQNDAVRTEIVRFSDDEHAPTHFA